MDFLSRLIGGVGTTKARKANSNHPQQRLSRFKKSYSQTLQVWHRLSSSNKQDPSALETVRTSIQRLTTLLHDDARAPSPHVCLSYAASSQCFLNISEIALALNNEDIIRETVGWLSALVDSDEESLLRSRPFAEAFMSFVARVSGSDVVGSQTETEVLELTFGIAAKIRLEPDLLPVWFLPEAESENPDGNDGRPIPVGDQRRFPLCYQFIGHVYIEGRAGDFARTGLLYIFESVSHSPELERWIIESDLPTLMATGLGALYSQLSRKLSISHPKDGMPLILALSDYGQKQIPLEAESFYSTELQTSLSTFMSNLVFWQDILEHCRSLEIKQTLIDHFQVFFLRQILYPSLLESSDIDGGSSVAVLTYLWRILDSVDHPDLIHLILQYLLALSNDLTSSHASLSPSLERSRQSLMSLSQTEGGEDSLNPSFFNLVDLIVASVQSNNTETVNAALRLITVLLARHHPYAFPSLVKTSTFKPSNADRHVGGLLKDIDVFLDLAGQIGGHEAVDEAYEGCLKDALSLVEAHVCSATKFGMGRVGFGKESRNRSAILEDTSREVYPHYISEDDPLLRSLTQHLSSFFTNEVELNLGVTNVVTHLAACPHTNLEGWLLAEPRSYKKSDEDTGMPKPDREDEREPDGDLEESEQARIAAFKAACSRPEWSLGSSSPLLAMLRKLCTDVDQLTKTIPELGQLIASRKRAFQGATELEQEDSPSAPLFNSPRPSTSASRDSSMTRGTPGQSKARQPSSVDTPTNKVRGRALTALSESKKKGRPSPSPLGRSPRPLPIDRKEVKLSGPVPNLSSSPEKAARALSPLSKVMNLHEGKGFQGPASGQSDAEVFERRIKFPIEMESQVRRATSEQGEDNSHQQTDHEQENEQGKEGSQATLNHVLTNIVILQEFILELAAITQVRASLVDGEIGFV